MKKYNKKAFARVLCLFFVLSAFGGGLIASEKSLGGGQTYAIDLPDHVIEGGIVEGDLITDEEGRIETDDKISASGSDRDSIAKEPADAEIAEEEEKTTSKSTRMQALADEAGTGAFLVTGGEAGKDYEFSGTTLLITSSTPLVIKNKIEGFTGNNIEIKEGITANITLAGVRIDMPSTGVRNTSPVNMLGAGTVCNLTLQKGSENTLNASKVYAAALHCSEGSTLTIHGSGTLNAYGGRGSAGIGSGFKETAGTMIFDDGMINTHAWRYDTSGATAPADSVPSNFGPSQWGGEHAFSGGAGIGAGAYGGSTSIVINGGEIHAYGSAHGAGIGASYNNASGGQGPQKGAVTTNSKLNLCGDITINGGYITSKGYSHGGAFGGSCGTTASGCTIRVNGGTLLPTAMGSNPDFNGNGTGKVYITGGSVRTAGGNKFMNGSTAGVAYDKDTKPVFMVTIDLSGEMEKFPHVKDGKIMDWEVLIAGEKYMYGAPERFDEGKLYLWLPEYANEKEVSVSLSVLNKEGETRPVDPFVIPKVDKGEKPVLKRYIEFELPEEWEKTLNKKYDGVAFKSYEWEKGDVESTEASPKPINKSDKIKIKVQRYDKKGGEAIEPEQEMVGTNTMPYDAGIYKLTVTSTQWADEPEYSASYWGHRATGWAIIEKVPSKMSATYAIQQDLDDPSDKLNYGKIKKVQLKATVQPGDGTKASCKAPDGLVQFYINGVKVGAPIDLSKTSAGELTVSGNVCNIAKTFDFDKDKYPAVPELDSGDFVVTAKYVDGTNYFENAADAKLVAWEEPGVDPGDQPKPPTLDEIVSKFPFINAPVPVITKDKDDLKDDEKVDGNKLVIVESERIEPDPKNPDPNVDPTQPDTWPIHGFFKDRINEKVNKDKDKAGIDYFVKLINDRYVFTSKAGYPLMEGTGDDRKPIQAGEKDITVYDKDGNKINLDTDPIDFSEPGKYVVSVTVTDENGNKCTIDINYNITKPMILDPDLNKDTNDDGIPDINIDTDDDGLPDINIDTDGDDKPDINIDTDGDKKPDVNVDTDGDGKPDINKDTDGDGKPDVDIDTDGDGKPDVNVDTDGDGKPDINKDTDGDGKPDVDIDTDGDGKPDINKDTDGDGKPDLDIDKDGDGKPDLNIDTDGDGKPDLNIDTDGDGKPDLNVDTNGDGKPDLNIDTDGDGIPDLNIDTDGDGIPDLNVDTDGDGIPDVNVDTDGDGKPDKNIKTPEEIENIIKEQNPETDELPWWIPRTGDTANMLIWLAVLSAAAIALGGTVYGIRKKKS